MPPAPTLRQTALDLVDLAHTVTGYRVLVEANPALATPAKLTMARGHVAAHRIEYNPDRVREPDYRGAVLCGKILRFFAVPPEDRRHLAQTRAGGLDCRPTNGGGWRSARNAPSLRETGVIYGYTGTRF